MKRLSSQEIKKIFYGVILSDGSIQNNKFRFDLYSKYEEYAKYISNVISQIHGVEINYSVKKDKRGYMGYRIFTKKHQYFKKIYSHVYNGRKELNHYNISRLNAQSLAHIWMCDGFLEHAKNRKKNIVQNTGWLCFEAYPENELNILRNHLKKEFNIESTLNKVPWGFGYRIRIGGKNLQKFISIIYPFILDCFKYKTPLFYKNIKRVDIYNLLNAEQYIFEYKCIEDIVRHPLKNGKTV